MAKVFITGALGKRPLCTDDPAAEKPALLAEEMSHRLKNVFAMADGMINVSARHSANVQDMATALTGPLHALAKAHSLVERRISALDAGKYTGLDTLIAVVRRVRDEDDSKAGHVRIAGPHVLCGAHAANSLALICHELTTNAAKYGALGTSGGHVDYDWAPAGLALTIRFAASAFAH